MTDFIMNLIFSVSWVDLFSMLTQSFRLSDFNLSQRIGFNGISECGSEKWVVINARSGDTLYEMVRSIYGPKDHDWLMQAVHVVARNSQISNPHRIFEGQAILFNSPLRLIRDSAPDLKLVLNDWNTAFSTAKSGVTGTAYSYDVLAEGLMGFTSGAVGFSGKGAKAIEKVVKANVDDYARWKNGKITKHHYYQNRTKRLKELNSKVGTHLKNKLFKNGSATQSFRITPKYGKQIVVSGSKGLNPSFLSQFKMIARSAKVFPGLGLAITLFSLDQSYREILEAKTREEKNDILLGTLGSVTAGSLSGVLFAVIAIPTGGISIAIIVGAGAVGAASSVLGSKGAKYFYDRYGNKVDLVAEWEID